MKMHATGIDGFNQQKRGPTQTENLSLADSRTISTNNNKTNMCK